MNIMDQTALPTTGPQYSVETHIPAKVMEVLERLPTLRDQFAMAALQGCLAYSNVNPMNGNYHENCPIGVAAQAAYAYADAMLEARKKGQPE